VKPTSILLFSRCTSVPLSNFIPNACPLGKGQLLARGPDGIYIPTFEARRAKEALEAPDHIGIGEPNTASVNQTPVAFWLIWIIE
jgi:hypothetical protein